MPEVKDKATGKTIAKMSYDTPGRMAAEKMVAENPGYEINDGSMRSETMYAGGGKTGFNQIGAEKPMMMGGGKMGMKYGHGGMTPEMKKYEEGGKTMKAVDAEENPGLSKLPKKVRNKMGYMKHGGKTKYKKGGKTLKQRTEEGIAAAKKRIKKGIKEERSRQRELESDIEFETYGYKGSPGEYSEKKQKAITKDKLDDMAEFIKFRKKEQAKKRKKKK